MVTKYQGAGPPPVPDLAAELQLHRSTIRAEPAPGRPALSQRGAVHVDRQLAIDGRYGRAGGHPRGVDPGGDRPARGEPLRPVVDRRGHPPLTRPSLTVTRPPGSPSPTSLSLRVVPMTFPTHPAAV